MGRFKKEMGIYSLKILSLDDILSDKTEIEHIIPRACGGSNAEYNKAVDLKNENAKKGNRIPLDYLLGEKKERYIEFVNELKSEYKINFKKFKNLMATSLNDAFKEVRDEVSLHATSYAEKLLGEILKRYYPFKNELKQNQRVMHISGRATSYLRRILSIDNKSRDTNFHHAEDAILIALMSRAYLQKISTNFEENYEKTKEKAKDNFKKIVPLIDGASPNEVFAHLRKSYMEDIENNPFYVGFDGTLRTSAYWITKKPIGTEVHRSTIQQDKNFNPYYVPYSKFIDDFLDPKKIKYNYTLSPESFSQKYDDNLLNKLYVNNVNPTDHISKAFLSKKSKIIEILKKANFATSKDEKNEFNNLLRNMIKEPIIDVNGNQVRRVKRVGEKSNFKIRNGIALVSPSMIAMRCSFESKTRLYTQRMSLKT